MKRINTFLFLVISIASLFAQTPVKSDSHSASQNVIVKIDGGLQTTWTKNETEGTASTSSSTSANENVSFSATANGIYVTISSGTNNIKLLALTGKLLLAGDLTQGRFFIPTRQGIYFLKVNNKSFKVICK
jgi:hypothetical protein